MQVSVEKLRKYVGYLLEIQDYRHDKVWRGILEGVKIVSSGDARYLVFEMRKLVLSVDGFVGVNKVKYAACPESVYKIRLFNFISNFRILIETTQGDQLLLISDGDESLVVMNEAVSQKITKEMNL